MNDDLRSPSNDRPMNVLVVDDDDGFRVVMQRRLTASRHQVECVPNGEAALERLAVRAFDVVLLDLRMPGLGGRVGLRGGEPRDPSGPRDDEAERTDGGPGGDPRRIRHREGRARAGDPRLEPPAHEALRGCPLWRRGGSPVGERALWARARRVYGRRERKARAL